MLYCIIYLRSTGKQIFLIKIPADFSSCNKNVNFVKGVFVNIIYRVCIILTTEQIYLVFSYLRFAFIKYVIDCIPFATAQM